jgi:polysaccharide biosynthesis protein PslG
VGRGLIAIGVVVVIAIATLIVQRVVQGDGPRREPAPRHLYGVQLHPLFDDQTEETVARELDLARESGANAVRIDIGWSTLELAGRGKIDRDYAARMDAAVDGARARGLHVIVTLLSTPCWASSAPESIKQGCQGSWWDRGVTAYPPSDPDRFGDIAGYVARRWGDGIAALEIWNEPNMKTFLTGPDPARDYGAMLRAAYPRVKEEQPGLPVLAGALVHADGDFLEAMFDRGRIAGNYDGISWHPYTDPKSPRARDDGPKPAGSFRDGAAWLRRILQSHGDQRAELWATEAGASTCAVGTHSRCVTPEVQARWIAEYVELSRQMPWLRSLIVYNLRDKGTDPADVEQGFGLVRRDFSPKPSYDALRRALGGR